MKCCSFCAKERGSIKFYKEFNKYLCDRHYNKVKERGIFYLLDGKINLISIEEEELGCAIIYIINSEIYDEYGAFVLIEERHEILIDIEDVEKVEDYKWIIQRDYIVSAPSAKKENNSIALSRFLLNCSDPKKHVDHINGDTFDNRKSNLRIVTPSQNSMNSKIRKNNTSGVTGVVKTKNGKYIAQIGINRKAKYLGTFDTIKEATDARLEAEDKYFGEYSFRNSRA